MHRTCWIALLYATLATATGCQSVGPVRAPGGEIVGPAPADAAMHLTVRVGTPQLDGTSSDANEDGALRDGQFVFEPGGLLAYGPRVDKAGRWSPWSLRRLDRKQSESLWALARNLGLGDPRTATGVVGAPRHEETPGTTIVRLDMTGWGVRWSHQQITSSGQPISAALQQLVDRMAALVWAHDATPVRTIVPRRYDFGPDPYARFRTVDRPGLENR